MQIEALERGHEEPKEMYGEENIISAVIRRKRQRPICIVIVPPTDGGIYRERRDICDERNAQDASEIFEARQSLVKFARLEPESTI